MPNLKGKIDGHNKKNTRKHAKNKIMQQFEKEKLTDEKSACLNENVSYYARICCDDETYKPKLYKGISETTFKKSHANHKKSINAGKNNNTKLSTEYRKSANEKPHPPISCQLNIIAKYNAKKLF